MQKIDILRDLTEPQREAVTHVEGPLLILAGAGSGKTRVITRRVAYLLQEGIKPVHVLAITFTNKAADEMKERVAALTTARGVRISTFHSFCARELRRFAERLELSPNYAIYDTDDRQKLIKQCIVALDFDTAQLKPSSVEAAISRAKNDMLSPAEFTKSAKDFYAQRVAKVYDRYEREMRPRQALDFDDLLVWMVRLLEDDKETREILQDQFRFVMVDEYQDTNDAQYRIVRELTRSHTNVCVTGDPDQAIYGWRGANIRNILSFERDYPKAVTVRLERNYRSTKTILAAAHELIVHNKLRKEKTLFTENPEGSRLRYIEAGDEEMESVQVAQGVATRLREGMKPHDVAVFYRINALSRTFEIAFRHARIPYRVIAGVEFFERREVRDVLAYLRLIANPADDIACERIVNVPTRGIGGKSLDLVKRFALAHKLPLFEALRRAGEIESLPAAARGAMGEFVELIRELSVAAGLGPQALLKQALDRTGYMKLLGKSDEDRNRRLNVEELVNAAASYEDETESPTLRGFLDEVALVSDQDELDDESPTVSLMTLHAAKGLEFPAVFIVGVEEGILPHERSRGTKEELEEERRLLYVGMTRAKRELTLSCALRRRKYGQFEDREPSSFIAEIPPKYLEGAGVDMSEFKRRRSQLEPEAGEKPAGRAAHRAGRPAREEPAETTSTLHAGDTVRHPQYGVGKVVSVSGSGAKMKVVVRFDRAGAKTLMVAFAKLEKLVAK